MSGSGGSGRRGDARRRRRSAGYEPERFHGHGNHGEDPLQRDDAWRTWLENHGRQRNETLPGPFVTSVRRDPMSPTQAMEGGLSAAGQGVDTRAHEVPANVSSLSSLSSPGQPGQTGQTGQTGQVGQTGTAGQNSVEAQLLQISQSLVSMRSDLQNQIGRSFGALERRLEAVETVNAGGSPVRNQNGQGQNPGNVFGQQYSGDGDCSFNRIGSPIRRNDRGQGSSGDTGRRRDVSSERDVLSKSEKWLPSPPEPGTNTWRDRESEITGFFKYVQALRAWSQLASSKMATEIEQSIKWPHEIVYSSLTAGQQARSSRLFALLKVAFAHHDRSDALIRAYEAGCAVHNSPQKPFGSCGYELIRVLALEFSLRTRTEAICLRSELLRREFKVDSKSMHVVSDLVRMIQVAINNYERLADTLPSGISREDLKVTSSDLALLFIRNLPHDAKQYCLLHSENETWEALQAAGLKYERQQRLYVELGAFSRRIVHGVSDEQDYSNETGAEWSETVDAVGESCNRCGKKTHKTSECNTDLTGIKCFKCGKTGHIGRNCLSQGHNQNKTDNKKPAKGGGKQDQKGKGKVNPKAKPKAKAKSKGQGKGKMYEVGEGEEEGGEGCEDGEWQETQEEASGSGLQMALLGSFGTSGQCFFDIVGTASDEIVADGSTVMQDSGPGLKSGIVSEEKHVSFQGSSFGLVGSDCVPGEDASWFDGLVCMPLLSSVETRGQDNWWLIDSGASVTVLSESAVKNGSFRIVSEEVVKDGPRFFAANGTEVSMKKKVVLQTFLRMNNHCGETVEREIKLSALVGNTSNNILSTTQLVERGWTVNLGKKSQLIHEGMELSADLISWAGCPWLYLGSKKGSYRSIAGTIEVSCENPPRTGESSISVIELNVDPVFKKVVIQNEMDEMHRARGHIPFDPNCAICQRTKGVSQHRRKQDGTNIVELAADFFFWKTFKFLIICERFSGMIGVVHMGPNTDHVRASVQRWLQEMGCLGDSQGVLAVSTDDEEAVGNVFSRLQVGKDVRVSKAPPQGQAMNGSAERSVRAIKENFVCVSEELRLQGLAVCETETAVGAVLEYVCFMLNSHASVHGSSKTPHEFLAGKNPSVSTRPVTSMFGSVVLCELPQSVQADDRPRFLEGAYLRPEFNSKSGLCLVMIDGVLKKIHPKSIKLVLPMRWEKSLLKGFCVGLDGQPEALKDAPPSDAIEFQKVRLSDSPPTEEPICPKGGPPQEWFRQYEMYTKDCAACRALELGQSRKGKVHSASCCANYVRWLRDQRQQAAEAAARERSALVKVPPNEWFDRSGYTPGCPACGALELGVNPDGLRHSSECIDQFERLLKNSPADGSDSMRVGVSGPSVTFDTSKGGVEVEVGKDVTQDSFGVGVKRPLERSGDASDDSYAPSIREEEEARLPSSQKSEDAQMADGGHVSTRGTKRVADEQLEPDPETFDVGESRKRPLEIDDAMLDSVGVCVTDDCSIIHGIMQLSEGFTGADMFFEDRSLQSVVYQGSSKSETVSFCGSSIRVWKPDYAVDDSTSNTLDGSLTFAGMLTEVGNLDRVRAGKPLKQAEATAKADEYGIRIIPCRWVTTEKVIDGEDGVRARIVVKDLASGGGKAKSLGISSPTPSAESIKMALGIGGYSNAHGWTLDCSAAFMHTPLGKERKVIVRFPASLSWPDGSPLFMELGKSLNGLRSASLDWLEYVQGIVKPLGLTCDVTSPCVFTAPGTVMIIYVDDLLIFSNKPDMGKKIWEKLNAVVPTKITGQLLPNQEGSMKFVGRVIRRQAGAKELLVGVAPGYLDSCYREYGMEKMKLGKAVVPNLRDTLDGPPEAPLSTEAYQRYRRSLGKMAWLSQTREDLHIFIAYLATGQHAPDGRHEKAMRQVLRFLLFDGDQELSFPSSANLKSLYQGSLELSEDPLMVVFCDASHAPMRATQRKGISGAFIFVLSSLVKGFSRHQTCTSLSSCEAEMFAIQETAQEAMGLLPLVRKMVTDFFGDFQGFEGRKFPILMLTDSESAKQLLFALDVPRKSRHTEVRIFWLREQLERWIRLGWIEGPTNLSDILTKCSSYHFVHRATCGFQPRGPAIVGGSDVSKGSSMPVEPLGHRDETVALIFIEFCCDEQSALKQHNTAFAYIGVTADGEEASTLRSVLDRVDRLCASALGLGMRPHVHFHASCPCASGSPIRYLRQDAGSEDVRFAELEPLLKRLPSYRKKVNTFSLEWPVNNALWSYPGVKDLLTELGLKEEAVVRLCKLGYVSRSGKPVGKRLRFVCDSSEFVQPLRRFQACRCKEHAHLNDVNWTETGRYNKSLALALCNAAHACARAKGAH